MYEGFVNAAKEVFGKRVKIVIDRFHVAKLYRSRVDSLRKQELKRLKQTLSEEEYGQLKGAIWGSFHETAKVVNSLRVPTAGIARCRQSLPSREAFPH